MNDKVVFAADTVLVKFAPERERIVKYIVVAMPGSSKRIVFAMIATILRDRTRAKLVQRTEEKFEVFQMLERVRNSFLIQNSRNVYETFVRVFSLYCIPMFSLCMILRMCIIPNA